MKRLTKDFGRIRALDDITLSVPQGAIFGLLGTNGAGKTTAIHLLLGLLRVTSGEATVLGFDVKTHASHVRSLTGSLLEHPGLYERLSAEDNLEFYGRAARMPASVRQDRLKELLVHFNLWDRRKQRVGTWSRGMKQKLAVARTLMHRPRLVFLDEPTDGLDPVAAAALREDLSALATQEGVTLFVTTHNLGEAERLCDQVAVLSAGKLLAVGQPAELQAHLGQSTVEITGQNFSGDVLAVLAARSEVSGVEAYDGRLKITLREILPIAPLISLLVRAGADVEEVRKGKVSLEEAFLKLVEAQR